MTLDLEKPLHHKGKYGTLVLSIAIFVLLDLGVLILNYYLSLQFQKDAININLAGRQRMLSQKISKSLAVSLQAYNEKDRLKMENAYWEAYKASLLFGKTLRAFALGGDTDGADHKLVTLQAVNETLQVKFVNKSIAIWKPYRDMLVMPNTISGDNLAKLNDYMIKHNLELLKLMNSITVGLEKESSGRAETLRNIQTVAMILVIANFIFILFHFIRQLRQRDNAIITYADGLLRHLEAVERQVRDEKASLLAQLDSKDALVDEHESSRRRRAIVTAFKKYLTPDQLMQALWLWEEDASSRLPRVSLFPFVKLVIRKLGLVSDKDYIYMELTRCYSLAEKKLDPDPIERMEQWRSRQAQKAWHGNDSTSNILVRLMNYIHALDAKKAIELRRHILSLQAQLKLSREEQTALREWLLGTAVETVPTVAAGKLDTIVAIVRKWCQSNFPPLVSQQIDRLAT